MKSLTVRFLTLSLLVTFFLSAASVVLAESPESFGLIPQKTLPGSTGYALKRLKEKATEFFKFSKDSKYSYKKELLARRVSEYVSLVEKKEQSQISNASQRLAFQAGVLAENSIQEPKETKDEIINLFKKYIPILEKMRDNFPANTPFWLLSQQDIDTMNILTDKLK
jgi:hypothetical protein